MNSLWYFVTSLVELLLDMTAKLRGRLYIQ